MKRYFLIPLLVFSLLWAASPSPAIAQEDIPPEEAATGKISGKIINQNNGNPVTGSMDVMLHIWDQEYVDPDKEHSTFDDIITDIARLDEAHEQGMIEPEEHKQRRQKLMLMAKEYFPEEFK